MHRCWYKASIGLVYFSRFTTLLRLLLAGDPCLADGSEVDNGGRIRRPKRRADPLVHQARAVDIAGTEKRRELTGEPRDRHDVQRRHPSRRTARRGVVAVRGSSRATAGTLSREATRGELRRLKRSARRWPGAGPTLPGRLRSVARLARIPLFRSVSRTLATSLRFQVPAG